ncbi:hypothetical protein GGR50DRAFT_692981 [Xylaria sp. CBS 124048]|nr:hypothetical protein GGR50DRAFT_692981 [Xylaria sp. CBS 124048]
MASASSSSAQSGSLAVKFEDFDLDEVFEKAKHHAAESSSHNFIVEFGFARARIAFDLEPGDIKELLEGERDVQNYPIRWINIWDPSSRRGAVAAVGNHYEFSERLVRIMQMPPRSPSSSSHHRHRHGFVARYRRRLADVESGDLDRTTTNSYALESRSNTLLQKDDAESADSVDDDSMDFYLQLKNTVYYCSTDHTRRALCIGAHWLHKRPIGEQEYSGKSMMPPKHWQWLSLCDDHTVVSIHEQPTFEPVPERENPDKWREAELKNMRANTLEVLLQLSKKGFDLYKRKPLSLNSVRPPLSKWHHNNKPPNTDQRKIDTSVDDESLADEGTSNLFYYLFEDYVAAEPLKFAEKKLEQMTNKVLDSARPQIRRRSVDIIPTLHYLSKDLREMKHLFENYRNIIRKITTLAVSDAHSPNGRVKNAGKVMLTDSAFTRFERLGDRLQYLMVNSIQGYLEDISALSSTYFNLTQQKDSEATARLTRSATLLAKLSVFFLPISFLTSYFSVQIEDLYKYWHGTDYWYSFAVIASVSFVCLFFFSRLLMFFSDTLDEWAAQIMASFRRLVRRLGYDISDDDD